MTSQTSTQPHALEDAIRMRAYLMWEADGRPHGLAEHYWMRASEVEFAAVRPVAEQKLAAPDVPAKVSAIKPKRAKAGKGKATEAEAKRTRVAPPDVKARAAGKAPRKSAKSSAKPSAE